MCASARELIPQREINVKTASAVEVGSFGCTIDRP